MMRRQSGDVYYSNCLLEAVKRKIRDWKHIRLMHVRMDNGLHHWLWHNLLDDNVYDFQQLETVRHWHNLLWFKGKIRIRSYKVYRRWLRGE